MPIDEPQFHTNEDAPYCTPCYTKIFAKICHACDEPILGVSIIYININYVFYICKVGAFERINGIFFMFPEGWWKSHSHNVFIHVLNLWL